MTEIVIISGARRGLRLPAGPATGSFGAAGSSDSASRGALTPKHEAIGGMSAKR